MVDTEGFDLEIVRQFLSLRQPLPLVIQLESYHLSREDRARLRSLLEERNYTYIDAEQDTVCFSSKLLHAQKDW